MTDAAASLFVDATTGDLHLSGCDDTSVVGAGGTRDDVMFDLDGDSRASVNDVGADQCSAP